MILNLAGIFTIEIDGDKVYLELPIMKNVGMMSSSRKISVRHQLVAIDPASRLRGIIVYGEHSPVDLVDGLITQLPVSFNIPELIRKNRMLSDKKQKKLFDIAFSDLIKKFKKITVKNFLKYSDKFPELSLLSKVSGSWVESICFDGIEYWNKSMKTMNYHLVKDPLPSDLRYREDILWLRYGDIPQAQKWKLRLELCIRMERKLREKLNAKRLKANK